MKWWLWLLAGFALAALVVLMFWGTGIGEKADPLFEPISSLDDVPVTDPRKLAVWAYGTQADQRRWQGQMEEFQQTVGEEPELVLFSKADVYRSILEEARREDRLPDLMLVTPAIAQAMAAAGELAPLAFPPGLASEWPSRLVQAFEFPGQPAALSAYPSDFSVLVLYYNKELLDGRGVAYPDDHWNWPIVSGISRGLYRKPVREKDTPVYGIELPLNLEFWNALAVQHGAPVYEGDDWQVVGLKVDQAQARALHFLLDFFYTYSVIAPPRKGSPGDFFLKGKSALLVGGAEMLPLLERSTGLSWGAALLPDEASRATSMKLEGWAVQSGSPKAREAAELALFLASDSQRGGWVPARSAGVPGQDEGSRRAFYRQVDDGVLPFRHEKAAAFHKATLEVFLEAIESGKIEPDEVVQTLNERLGLVTPEERQPEGEKASKSPPS